jgi:hypothetical protein
MRSNSRQVKATTKIQGGVKKLSDQRDSGGGCSEVSLSFLALRGGALPIGCPNFLHLYSVPLDVVDRPFASERRREASAAACTRFHAASWI